MALHDWQVEHNETVEDNTRVSDVFFKYATRSKKQWHVKGEKCSLPFTSKSAADAASLEVKKDMPPWYRVADGGPYVRVEIIPATIADPCRYDYETFDIALGVARSSIKSDIRDCVHKIRELKKRLKSIPLKDAREWPHKDVAYDERGIQG